MSSNNNIGKTLKNVYNSNLRAFSAITVNNIVASNLSLPFLSGNTFSGIEITASDIDDTVIGASTPAEAYFTTLQSGSLSNGYEVNFYGNNSTYLNWNPNGTLSVEGQAYISNFLQVGNLKISGNNLEAINSNGNVNLVPNGSGIINLEGPVYQNATGSSSFISSGTVIIASSEDELNLSSYEDNTISSERGHIYLKTDLNLNTYTISSITNHISGILITLTSNHNYLVNDQVYFDGTNSVPNLLNTNYTILSIPSSNSFIIPGSVSVIGTTGTVSRKGVHNIYLQAGNSVIIEEDIPLYFDTSSILSSNNNLNLVSSGDINLNSSDINIPSTSNLNLGSSYLTYDNSTLTINSTNIELESRVSNTSSIITLGQYVNDGKDRGIEFKTINNSISDLLFAGFKDDVFTVLKNCTNNNDVLTGTLANIEVFDIAANSINVPLGYINQVEGDPDLFLNATRDIYLNASRYVRLNDNKELQFNVYNKIYSNLNDLYIIASSNLILNTASSGAVRIPTDTKLSFSNTDNIYWKYNGSILSLTSPQSISFNLASGSIFIPDNISLTLGPSTQNIINSGSELTLNSDNHINIISQNGYVFFPANQKLVFGTSFDYITGQNSLILNTNGAGIFTSNQNLSFTSNSSHINLNSGQNIYFTPGGNVYLPVNKNFYLGTSYINSTTNNLNLVSTNINLNATSNINIPQNIPVNFGSNKYIYGDTNDLNLYSDNNINLEANTVNINANLQVSGTLTYIDTVITTITDPVIQLGSDTINDLKDRGVSFLWNNGVARLGFFGYKANTGRLTYIPQATEINNVFSGTKGDLDIGFIYSTGLDLNNGNINSINTLTTVNLNGNPDLTITATNLYLDSQATYLLSDKPLYFGGTDTYLSGNNNTLSSSSNQLILNTNPGGYITLNSETINIPIDSKLYLGSSYLSFSSSVLNINNPVLNLQNTSVNIPNNSSLNIGTSEIIEDTEFNFNTSLPLNLNSSDSVNLNINIPLNLGSPDNYIIKNNDEILVKSSSEIVLDPDVSIVNNLSIGGNITSGTWNGTLIELAYGGTNKNSWLSGSVVFAGTTSLLENNNNFYWDNTNYYLGLATNNPLHRLHLTNEHLLIHNNTTINTGILFYNENNNYTARIYKPHSSNQELIIATGIQNSYTNLTPRLTILTNGKIGINFTNSNDITELLHINGNVLVEDKLKFTNSDYIEYSTGPNSGISIYSNNINIPQNTLLNLGTSQFYTDTNNDLYISSTGDIYVNSNSNIYIPISDRLYLGNSYLVESSGILSLNNNTILLNALDINIPIDSGLNLGTSQFYTDTNNDLYISSSGDIYVNPNSNIYIPVSDRLYLGNSYLYQNNVSSDLTLYSPNNIYLNPVNDILIDDNISLVFGDNSRRIESDGTLLQIYGSINMPGDLTVNNLTVTGTQNVINLTDYSADAHIFTLGGGTNLTIVSITDPLPTSNTAEIQILGNHNLVVGDQITLTDTDSNPVIDGTYIVQSVVNSSTITINIISSIITPGTSGTLSSKHTFNLNKDIGIQANWHNGTTGTIGAKYAFFGFDRSELKWTFILDGTNTADVFAGTLGDIKINTLYSNYIASSTLSGTLNANTQQVLGSNFIISGGTINGTPIGNTSPSTGNFTNLVASTADINGGTIDNAIIGATTPSSASFTTISVSSSGLVNNLNAQYVNGFTSSDLVLRNGSQGLTNNWNAGNYKITIQDLNLNSSNINSVIFTDSSKNLTTDSGFTYDNLNNELNVSKIGSFESTGVISNVNISGGSISNVDINLDAGDTLDATGATLIFSASQIDAQALFGTGNINISGNATTVTNGVYKTDFNSYTILKADADNTPVPLTIPEETLVGRLVGGNIEALTKTEVRDLLDIQTLDEAAIDAAGGMLKSGTTMTGMLNYSSSRITISGGSSVSLSSTTNLIYVSVSGTGTATGTLIDGTSDGQWKMILISNLAINTSFQMTFNTNKLITPDGNTSSKTLTFNKIGQSIHLIWDNFYSRWMLMPGGLSTVV